MSKLSSDTRDLVRARNGGLPEPAERRAIRVAAGLSQRELARELGCSVDVLRGWEHGRHEPSPRLLVPYTRALRALTKSVRRAGDDREASSSPSK